MYLITSKDTGVDYIVKDEDVSPQDTGEKVVVGDEVMFWVNAEEQIEGIIIMCSESEKKLIAARNKRTAELADSIEKYQDISETANPTKRKPIPKKIWTPTDSKKKVNKNDSKKPQKPQKDAKFKAQVQQQQYQSSQARVQNIIKNATDTSNLKRQRSHIIDSDRESTENEMSPKKKIPSKREKEIHQLKALVKDSPQRIDVVTGKPIQSWKVKPLTVSSMENLPSTSKQSRSGKKISHILPSKTRLTSSDAAFESQNDYDSDGSHNSSTMSNHRAKHLDASPTKEELKKQLKKLAAQLKSKEVQLSSEDSDSETDDHVYGKNWRGPNGEKMVHLKNGVYCRKSIYTAMDGGSNNPSHIVRRLVDGVFNRDFLHNRTCTGRSDHTKKEVVETTKTYPLNPKAKNAIIDYAIEYAERTKATQTKTKKELLRSLAQRLCEIKEELKNGA